MMRIADDSGRMNFTGTCPNASAPSGYKQLRRHLNRCSQFALRGLPMKKKIASAIACLILGITAAHTQQKKPAPPACSSAEHHQFDFWVGDWDASWPSPGGSKVVNHAS